MAAISPVFAITPSEPEDYNWIWFAGSPGTYNVVVPNNIWSIGFLLVGGGGGGGYAFSQGYHFPPSPPGPGGPAAGGGGAGGGVVSGLLITYGSNAGPGPQTQKYIHRLPVRPGETLIIKVGAGGAGANTLNQLGGDGEVSSIKGSLFSKLFPFGSDTIEAQYGGGGAYGDQRFGSGRDLVGNGGYCYGTPGGNGGAGIFTLGIGGAGGGAGGSCLDAITPGVPAPGGPGELLGEGGAGGRGSPGAYLAGTGGDGGAALAPPGGTAFAKGGDGHAGLVKLWGYAVPVAYDDDLWGPPI